MRINPVTPYSSNIKRINKNVAKYTNDDAVKLLRKELSQSMEDKQINNYVNMMKGICNKLKIQFKDLPINKEHPGNLSNAQNRDVCEEIYKIIVQY